MIRALGIDLKTFVEVGVYTGVFSKIMREQFPEAMIYMIDPFEIYDGYAGKIYKNRPSWASTTEEAKRKVTEKFQGDKKAKLIVKYSEHAVEDIPQDMDCIFIDANHEYPYISKDVRLYYEKVRKGGLFCGHDFHMDGVKRAVTEFCQEKGIEFAWCRHDVANRPNVWFLVK
jgi:predicted O-methyltransferase YrrM